MDVRMPDGTIVRNVPDGMSKQELLARFEKRRPVSFGQDVGRRAADTGAALVEGLFGLPDLAASGIGKGLGVVARAVGADGAAVALERPFTVGGAARGMAPEIEGNAPARVVANAVGGTVGGVGLGGLLARGATGATAGIARELAAKPVLQTLGGLGGGVGVEVARGAGGSVPVQIAAGILGGGVAPGSVDAVGQGINAGARATMRGPQYAREAAAAVLKRNTQGDANAVGRRILAAPVASAGTLPTTAEAAMDPGLAGFQRSLTGGSNVSGAAISERMANNAAARRGTAVATFGDGDVNAVPDLAARRLSNMRQDFGAAVEGVGELVPPDVSGAELRALLMAREQATKAAAQARYRIDGGDEPIQIGPVEPNFVDDLPAGPSADTLSREAFRREGAAFAGGTEGRAFGAAAKPGQTLMGWVKSKGGINANSVGIGDLYAAELTPKSVPGLFNNNRGSFTQGAARSNAGVMGKSIDELASMAMAEGFLPEGSTADDFAQLLTDDFNANRVGSQRVRPGERSGADAVVDDGRDEARQWWGREFQDRGLDPERMTADDWDAMYRDVQGVAAPEVTQAGMARNAGGGGGMSLSPFQASMMELRRQMFPSGVGINPDVDLLVKNLAKAGTMTADELAQNIVFLRRKAGALKGGESAGLAKAAANAAEGFLNAQSGPARADALREARRFYRDDYKGVFANNEPGRVLATDQFGRPRMDDGNIPAVAVPTGRTGADAARRLGVAAGPDAAQKAAREELRRALDMAGNDPARIARVSAGYADTLRAYPELQASIDRAAQLASAAETLANSPLGLVGKGGDPVKAIGTILAKGDGGRDMIALAASVRGDEAATAGLRRALAETLNGKALSRAGVGADESATTLNNGLRQGLEVILNRTAMTNLLERPQREALKAIKRETDRAQFAATANRAPGSDTGRNADMWGNLFASVVAGGVPKGAGVKTVIDAIVAMAGRADAVRDVATQAMLDPKLAAELLMSPSPERMKSLASRMQAYARGSLAGSAGAAKPYSTDRM